MTKKPEALVNFFLRTALTSGNRSRILMGDHAALKGFHDVAGAAVAAQTGNGYILATENDEQAAAMPWAAQYVSPQDQLEGVPRHDVVDEAPRDPLQ